MKIPSHLSGQALARASAPGGSSPAVAVSRALGGIVAPSLILFVPTVWALWNSLWQDATHSHGPIVLAVIIWLFARSLRQHVELTPSASRTTDTGGLPWLLALMGWAFYVVGRSQSLYVLEVGSAIPLLVGLTWLSFGRRMVAKVWFPIFFILFLVPLPGSFVDAITHPLKLGVSWATEHLLAAMDYPVARSGVILNIGPYQMFVADACAGLTSLFMLEAFGLLYLNVVRHASAIRNVVLAVLIVPISFASNVLRVLLLCLITFHLGDEAGQGFLHTFSGMVLFVAALALTVSADTGARVLASRFQGAGRGAVQTTAVTAESPGVWPAVRSWSGYGLAPASMAIVVAVAVAAVVAAKLLTPTPVPGHSVGDLEQLIPREFGDWRLVQRPGIAIDVLANEPGETTLNNPYDQVVMRVYRHTDGRVVELAVAYGKHQRQEVKIHQPELCFNSQGYRIQSRTDTVIQRPLGSEGPTITGKQLYSESQSSKLAATYWIRIGRVYADSAWETRGEIFREGLKGRSVDGVLVRATVQVGRADEAQQAHGTMNVFLSDLLAHSSAELRQVLAP